jgi:2-dehydro-3-deoxyglucarate aldolase/4-hydroxy-2-oxoheptanedioate aldolase
MTNLFKQRLGAHDAPLIGAWLMSASATCAEAAGWTGLDFVVVDMEHVPLSISDTAGLLRALASTPAGVITRVPWNDPVTVKRVLDAGAQTVMFPMIQSVEEATRAVLSTRYPGYPAGGTRGVAGVHRASRYGAVPDYLRTSHQHICVVAQIETPTAYDRMPAIAAVDGVDAIFVGPGDLAANMGHLGELGHPEVLQRIMDAPALVHAQARKKIGILVPDTELGRRCTDAGYDFVAIGSDISAITATMKRHLAAWGRTSAVAAAATSGY